MADPGIVRVLMGKEWRHLARSRAAMATALLLPASLLLAVPRAVVRAVLSIPRVSGPSPIEHLPPALRDVTSDPHALLYLAMPLLVAMTGIVVPAVAASYTMVIERESRTLELLAALPIRVGQVLLAKLGVVVIAAAVATTLMLGWQCAHLLALGLVTPGYVAALFALLYAALTYSASLALLASLLARDFRTASNVNGALLGPTIFGSLMVLLFVAGPVTRIVVLAGLFGLAALVSTAIATRVVTFERLLR